MDRPIKLRLTIQMQPFVVISHGVTGEEGVMSSPEGIPKGGGQLALRNLPELGKLAADIFFPPVAQQFFIAVVFVNPDQVSDDLPIIQFLSLL